jgi:diguanylate cyclase (GGDEF)-like protein
MDAMKSRSSVAGQKRPIIRWLARRSLRERIGVSLALLVFLVAILLGGLVGRASEVQARGRIGQSLAIDAQRLGERLSGELATRARELGLLTRMDPLRTLAATVALAPAAESSDALTPARAQTQALLDELRHSYPAYAWIAVAAPSGRVLAATGGASLGTTIAPRGANRDGLRGPAQTRLQPLPEDLRMIDLLQPVRDADGSVIGLIVAQLPWSWVRDIERSTISADEDGEIRRETFLIGAQDNVVLGPPDTAGTTLPIAAAARARAGMFGWQVEPWPPVHPGEAAGNFLTGAAFATGDATAASNNVGFAAQGLRWSVLVREAEGQAFAPATELRQNIWIAGLLVALVFAGAGWLLAGLVTSPLVRIAEAAERLRQGDDVEIPRIRGAAEIDSLSISLRALVATLTRKQAALDEMEELALRDPLTGLFNRHGLRLHLDATLASAHATGGRLLLFVGDLDGFKKVNDTMGHATGDQLLRLVGARLKQSVRRGDLVARIGGDEFVLALPAPSGPGDAAALTVARRAQAAVSAPYQIGGAIVTIGCSLGGACWPDHLPSDERSLPLSEEIDQVLSLADNVLYTVKRSGKGRMDVMTPQPLRIGLPDQLVDERADAAEQG